MQGLGRFPGGGYFLVLDLIEGEDLQRRIERALPAIDEAVRTTIAVAEAIQHAHEHGVIHGDLKPSNVLVDRAGNVYVTDFGLARLLPSGDEREAPTDFAGGTLSYMAPEFASGEAANEPVDVYGLGSLLYALLTGRPTAVRPSAFREDVPPELEAIVMKCLEGSVLARYATAKQVVESLEQRRTE